MSRELDLESLIQEHSSTKNSDNKVFHRKLTAGMFVFTLAFFAVIGLSFITVELNGAVTGMTTFVGQAAEATGEFVDDVKTSPERPKILLFFYIIWILVVLIIIGALTERELSKKLAKRTRAK